MRYNVHLPVLYLQYGRNLCTLMLGSVLPIVQGHVLCNNWLLCGMCWEDCERKK